MIDPIPFPIAKFRFHTDDPTFEIAWKGGGRFRVTGEVSGDPSSEVDLQTPDDEIELHLAQHSRPEHLVDQLRRALPRDIAVTDRRVNGGIDLILQDALVPAAKPPRLRILSSDPIQRVLQLDDNKVEFVGNTGDQCHITILCDTRRVTLSLAAGCSAKSTAEFVAANVPHGFRALVAGAVVSVWKDADYFEQVA